MHDLDPHCMHSLEEEKKNRSAYCATIWHWEWSASCRVRDVCRTICKDCTEYACAVCALVFLCLNVSHLVLMSILEIEVLMSRSWPLGMIWKKIKKEKKNVKGQTGKSGFMRAEKCVAARLTQCCIREIMQNYFNLCPTPHPHCPNPFMSPIITQHPSKHVYMCFHHLHVCAYARSLVCEYVIWPRFTNKVSL